MKKIGIIGAIVVLLAVAIAMKTAFETGEKSPIYAAGEVVLDEALVDQAKGMRTLFFIVYDADSPRPMPFGAVKETISDDARSGSFFQFMITKEKLNLMQPDLPPPTNIRLKVRLDRDGQGGMDQAGDLTGGIDTVAFGSNGLQVKLDKSIQ